MTGFSTGDVETLGPFAPHGRLDYDLNGRVLSVLAEGPFNAEVLQAIGKAEAAVVDTLTKSGPWGEVVVCKTSALCPPELLTAWAAYMKAIAVEASFLPTVALVVGPDVEGGSLMSPLFLKCYQEAGVQCRVFDNYSAALAWVQSVLEA